MAHSLSYGIKYGSTTLLKDQSFFAVSCILRQVYIPTKRNYMLGNPLPLQTNTRNTRPIVCSTDYVAALTDDNILQMPSKTELFPEQYSNIFGYARNLEENYILGRVIGSGSFGIVRECVQRSTGKRYAVKTIGKTPKRGPCTPRYLLKIRTEVEIMRQLGNSLDAVNLNDVFEDDDHVHLVMDLCEGGALLERIDRRVYSERFVAPIVRSILRFVSQCHAKGIVYRDVKPDNFLFMTNEPNAPLKAIDFGLSIRHTPNEPKLSSRSGTPAYMAPELISQEYDEKCDIWSVGMLAYQMLTGRFPFWEDVRGAELGAVWRAILSQPIDWNADEVRTLSSSAKSFLKKLLTRDPSKRPSAAEALEHPWVREANSAVNLPLQGSVVQRLQRFSTYGQLKRMVLRMVTEELQSEEEAASKEARASVRALKELFRQIDTDSSGTISFDELREGLSKQGYVLHKREVEMLMKKVDNDQNGTIDISEFITTLIDWGKLQSDKKWVTYLDNAFTKMDHDGNGTISLDELLEQLPKGTVSDTERLAEAKLMLREADTDGDGCISREEFYSLLKEDLRDSLNLYDGRLSMSMSLSDSMDMPATTGNESKLRMPSWMPRLSFGRK